MKTYRLFAAVCVFCLLIISCEKDSLSADDSLIGSWKGTLIQPQFGELVTVLNISSSDLSTSAGTGSYNSGDISVCDDNIFNCIPLACTFNLKVLSKSGAGFFELDQMLIETNSTCGDGIFEITSVNNNKIDVLWYQEEFPDNKARGSLTRQ